MALSTPLLADSASGHEGDPNAVPLLNVHRIAQTQRSEHPVSMLGAWAKRRGLVVALFTFLALTTQLYHIGRAAQPLQAPLARKSLRGTKLSSAAASELAAAPAAKAAASRGGCSQAPAIPGASLHYPNIVLSGAIVSSGIGGNLSGTYQRIHSESKDRDVYRASLSGGSIVEYLVYGQCEDKGCWMLWSQMGSLESCTSPLDAGCALKYPDAFVIDDASFPESIKGDWQVCPVPQDKSTCSPLKDGMRIVSSQSVKQGEVVRYGFGSAAAGFSALCGPHETFSIAGKTALVSVDGLEAQYKSGYQAGLGAASGGAQDMWGVVLVLVLGSMFVLMMMRSQSSGSGSKEDLHMTVESNIRDGARDAADLLSTLERSSPGGRSRVPSAPQVAAPIVVPPAQEQGHADAAGGNGRDAAEALPVIGSRGNSAPRGLLRIQAPGAYFSWDCTVGCEVQQSEHESNGRHNETLKVLLSRSSEGDEDDAIASVWRLTDFSTYKHKGLVLEFGRQQELSSVAQDLTGATQTGVQHYERCDAQQRRPSHLRRNSRTGNAEPSQPQNTEPKVEEVDWESKAEKQARVKRKSQIEESESSLLNWLPQSERVELNQKRGEAHEAEHQAKGEEQSGLVQPIEAPSAEEIQTSSLMQKMLGWSQGTTKAAVRASRPEGRLEEWLKKSKRAEQQIDAARR